MDIDIEEFYHEEKGMWLLDADMFISEMKNNIANELKAGVEFGLFIGINKDNQFEFWVRDADGFVYNMTGDHNAMNFED